MGGCGVLGSWHDQHCLWGARVAAVGGCQRCFSPSRSPKSPNCSSQPTSSSSLLTRAASSSPLLEAPSMFSSCWNQGAANTRTRCAHHQVRAGGCWGSLVSEFCTPCRCRGVCRAESVPPILPLLHVCAILMAWHGWGSWDTPISGGTWVWMFPLGRSGAPGRPEQPLQPVGVLQRPPRPFTYWQ